MIVSICISTYNALELTRQCFDSLLASAGGTATEIIVIDDASTDGTAEYLSTLRAPFRVVVNATNQGYACCNNAAARMARGEVLCLLNADTLLRPGWIEPMLDLLQSRPDAGFVGNVQFNPNTRRYDHMGVVVDADLKLAHFGSGWRFVPFRRPREWISVTAACCVIRRELFLNAGGFDEAYRNGYEDTDLCLRLGQKGYRHLVTYDSRIEHYVSSSPGRHDHEDANRQLFLQRWRSVLEARRDRRERRLAGLNYLGRYWDRPWKYNGRKLVRAWSELTGAGPASAACPDRSTQ